MSHELRTPLNSVIGFANVLMKNPKGLLGDRELGFLDRILSNGRHLLGLINEVLDLAKIESGRSELQVRPVDVGSLVRETVAQLEGQVRDREVLLQAEVPDGIRPVDADEGKLRQVIINLVGNALKFTERGSVVVRIDAEDGVPRAVAVQDTGIGIAPDRLQAIFEAFQQADSSTTRRFGGTGLGLTISRSICQLMGYDLTVKSRLGEGSTFTIHLYPSRPDRPEDRPQERRFAASANEAGDSAGARSESRSPSPGGPRRRGASPSVLVIDDESDSRLLMSHYLLELGLEVHTAAGALEGMEIAREYRPDLITLDLMMPEVNGWEALRRLKADAELRDIPVVVASIVAGEGKGKLLGAVDLLEKPIDRDALTEVLWRTLGEDRSGPVLVVDDDEDSRELFRYHLSGLGFDVETAINGLDALSRIHARRPRAVLLDLMMPVMDGLTCLQRLRDNPRFLELPVVVVTSKQLTDDEVAELDRLSSTLVRKGSNVVESLATVLRPLLERQRSRV
jgi:CheY-like chemotaxis protein